MIYYKNIKNTYFHLIKPLAFNILFENCTLIYIYSQGVVHYSIDTKTCFNNIAKLFKWFGFSYTCLKNKFIHNKNFFRKLILLIKKTFSPLVWHLPSLSKSLILFPFPIIYKIYQNIFNAKKKTQLIKYTLIEAFNTVLYRFISRFASRYLVVVVIIKLYHETGFINPILSNIKDYTSFLIPTTAVIDHKS